MKRNQLGNEEFKGFEFEKEGTLHGLSHPGSLKVTVAVIVVAGVTTFVTNVCKKLGEAVGDIWARMLESRYPPDSLDDRIKKI